MNDEFIQPCGIKYLCLLFGIVLSLNLSAQDSLSTATIIATDTLLAKKAKKFSVKNYFKNDYPSPKKAVTLAIIPGMGQIYNKRYWKAPIAWGLLGGVVYFIDVNTKKYNDFRKAYDAKTNPDSMYENPYPNIPTAALKSARDGYDKNRQLSWVGLVGFYLISAGEAFADAHLKDFNVDDDISFQPILQTVPDQPAAIGLSIKIKLSK